MPVEQLLLGVLLPAVVAGVGLLLAARHAAAGAAVVWLAYTIGHAGAYGAPRFPPALGMDAAHWVPYAAWAAALLGLLDAVFSRPRPDARPDAVPGERSARVRALARRELAWLVPRLALAAAALYPVLHAKLEFAGWGAGHLALSAALLSLGWTGLDVLAETARGADRVAVPPVLWAVASCAAVAIGATGSVRVALPAATLAGVAGAAFVVTLLRREASLARGPVPVVAVALGGLLASATAYSELHVAAAALVSLAPWAALAGWAPPLAGRPVWARAAVALLATLAVGGAAAGAGVALLPARPDSPYADLGY